MGLIRKHITLHSEDMFRDHLYQIATKPSEVLRLHRETESGL